jgi:hypothetical protein
MQSDSSSFFVGSTQNFAENAKFRKNAVLKNLKNCEKFIIAEKFRKFKELQRNSEKCKKKSENLEKCRIDSSCLISSALAQ